MLSLLAVFAAGLAGVTASFDANLAYRSPHPNVPELGISTHRLRARQLNPQGLGVQQLRPPGDSANYLRYGEATDWSQSDYIYAGRVNFTHGVASGDPWDTSVLLWTRAFPLDVATRDVPVCLTYEVRTGVNMTGTVVSKGALYSSFDVDNTFKVEAKGLSPSTFYYYQFTNCAKTDEKSIVGRTKTAPGKTASSVGTQRFAVYSCSNFPNGFFNSYGGPVANQDVDYVIHLGDYIYEKGDNKTGASINRTVLPEKEIFTVQDYRQRYATYRTDPDLLASHAQFPWINIWDDHEIANNIWKAGTDNSNDTEKGCAVGKGVCFTERAANAKRAYHEWIPIREVDVSNEKRIWRDFRFGDLVDLVALDTRQYDRDVTDNQYNADYVATLSDVLNSTRSLTGLDQEKWLVNTIDSSVSRGTKWRLVLNQIILGTVAEAYTSPNPSAQMSNPGSVIDLDAWDGYQAQRKRLFDYAYDKKWDNTLVVSGDSHANWLFQNNKNTLLAGSNDPATIKSAKIEQGYVRGQLIEFAGTAVSSSGYGSSYLTEANSTSVAAKALVRESAGLLWTEGFYRGYMAVEISPTNVTTSYWAYPDNQVRRTQDRVLSARFVVKHGTNNVERPITSNFGAVKPSA